MPMRPLPPPPRQVLPLLTLLLLQPVAAGHTVKLPAHAEGKTVTLDACTAAEPVHITEAKYGQSCCDKNPRFRESCKSGQAFKAWTQASRQLCDGQPSCEYIVCRCSAVGGPGGPPDLSGRCGAQHCVPDPFPGCK